MCGICIHVLPFLKTQFFKKTLWVLCRDGHKVFHPNLYVGHHRYCMSSPPTHTHTWLPHLQALACCPGHPLSPAVQSGQEPGLPFPASSSSWPLRQGGRMRRLLAWPYSGQLLNEVGEETQALAQTGQLALEDNPVSAQRWVSGAACQGEGNECSRIGLIALCPSLAGDSAPHCASQE